MICVCKLADKKVQRTALLFLKNPHLPLIYDGCFYENLWLTICILLKSFSVAFQYDMTVHTHFSKGFICKAKRSLEKNNIVLNRIAWCSFSNPTCVLILFFTDDCVFILFLFIYMYKFVSLYIHNIHSFVTLIFQNQTNITLMIISLGL